MNKLYFPNFASAAMYECEFEGQVSDGKYEDVDEFVDELYEGPHPGSVWYEDEDEEANAWDEYDCFRSELYNHWKWVNDTQVEVNPAEKPHNTNCPHMLHYEFHEWLDVVRHFLDPEKYPECDTDYYWTVRLYHYAKAAKAWQTRLSYDQRYLIDYIGSEDITDIKVLEKERDYSATKPFPITQEMLDKFWATDYTLEEFEQDYDNCLKAMNMCEK